MAFNVIFSLRAEQEIFSAIEFYASKSTALPEKFTADLSWVISRLSEHPYCQIKYRNIRAISFKKFPYTVYFTLDEVNQTVEVRACFHHKRNPEDRPD